MLKKLLTLTLFLSSLCFSKSTDLAQYEGRVYSQNGEDGVIQKIFELIGTDSQYYVEFGAFDGNSMANTKFFREHCGWNGLLLDGGFENPSINLHKEFITAENINELFAKYEVPYNLDLLSIDIDFNDFHVWKALDSAYKPRVVVIEFNATHPPGEDKVVKYHATNMWDGTNYFGASIQAFYNLGRSKGYSLVYCENQGVNLFFVRDDLIQHEFKDLNDPEKLYKKPRYGQGPNGGHKQDPQERKYISSANLL